MKTITKLAVATLLAFTAAAPAFAYEGDTPAYEMQGSRQAARHVQATQRVSQRADANAFAYEPAPAANPYDFGILSQH